MNWIADDFAMTDLLPCLTAAILAASQIIMNWHLKKRDVKIDLQKQLAALLEITIKYPYLEDKNFTETWNQWKANGCPYDERYLRYDQFANILFNYLETLYNENDKDKKKIENVLDVKSWIWLHKYIWKNPRYEGENVNGYSDDFRSFINSYLQ